jgi:hypothetical protein
METKQIAIHVLFPTDYNKIFTIKGNRDIGDRRKNLAISSIESIGMIGQVYASRELFRKTGRYYIIDGQARVEALKTLNKDIPIQLIDGNVIELMKHLNRHQRQWGTQDFVNLYCEIGSDFSKCVKEVMDKYNVKNITALHACYGASVSGSFQKQLINGKEYHAWDERFLFMDALSALPVPYKFEMPFVRAYMRAFKALTEKQREKLDGCMLRIKKQAYESDYLVCFENMLNARLRKDKISLTPR